MAVTQQIFAGTILKVQLNFLDSIEPRKALKVAGSGLV